LGSHARHFCCRSCGKCRRGWWWFSARWAAAFSACCEVSLRSASCGRSSGIASLRASRSMNLISLDNPYWSTRGRRWEDLRHSTADSDSDSKSGVLLAAGGQEAEALAATVARCDVTGLRILPDDLPLDPTLNATAWPALSLVSWCGSLALARHHICADRCDGPRPKYRAPLRWLMEGARDADRTVRILPPLRA
jgi:hypothetical protein